MVEAPTLRTERLVMIPLSAADLDETAALYGDPDVMQFVAGGVMDRPTTAAVLGDAAESWKHHGYGLWAIRDASTGAFLGEGGLQRSPPLDGVDTDVAVDFGYTLCRRGWGNGYATEAGQALLQDAWERYDGPEIHALVTSDNLPSHEVLRKLRFTRVARLMQHDRAHQLWAVERPG